MNIIENQCGMFFFFFFFFENEAICFVEYKADKIKKIVMIILY